MKFCSILVFLAALAGSQAVITQGACPDFTNFQEFEVAPYLGRWYEIERFAIIFEGAESCITADYGLISETEVSVTNSGVTLSGEIDSIVGSATPTGVPGQLLVSFAGHADALYNVLYTDYEVSAVYNCINTANEGFKDEFAWVLSRNRTIDAATLAVAEDAFIQNGIDVGLFSFTYQGEDCIYLDEP